jgi:HPt (histidine-containing phosphotransfer) domain-containing protein
VALTANALDSERQRCMEAGMDGHLSKPISPEQLIAAIEERVTPAGPRASGDSIPACPGNAAGGNSIRAGGDAVSEIPAGTNASSTMRELPFDLEELRARCMNNDSFMADILAMFAAKAPKNLAELRQAIAAGEAVEARRLAHSLRGAGGNIGAAGVREAAATLEQICASGRLQDAEEALSRLNDQLDRCVEHIPGIVKILSDSQA